MASSQASVAPLSSASSSGAKDVFQRRLGFTPSLKKKQDEKEMADETEAKLKSGSSMRSSSSGKAKLKLEPLQKTKSGAKTKANKAGGRGGGLVADAETNEFMNPGSSKDYTAINLPSSADDDLPSTRSSHIDILASNANGANGDLDETAGFMNPSKRNLPVVQEGAVGLLFDNTGEQMGVVTEVTHLHASSLFVPSTKGPKEIQDRVVSHARRKDLENKDDNWLRPMLLISLMCNISLCIALIIVATSS